LSKKPRIDERTSLEDPASLDAPEEPLLGRVPSPGPVAIGQETIRDFAERETRMGTLRLLAPTECVMDRLAWYFHNADTQCLEQAVDVATRHPVDLKRIEKWARAEQTHGKERFREFEHRLRESTGA